MVFAKTRGDHANYVGHETNSRKIRTGSNFKAQLKKEQVILRRQAHVHDINSILGLGAKLPLEMRHTNHL